MCEKICRNCHWYYEETSSCLAKRDHAFNFIYVPERGTCDLFHERIVEKVCRNCQHRKRTCLIQLSSVHFLMSDKYCDVLMQDVDGDFYCGYFE